MIFNELNTSLRFYNDVDKQNRFRDVCQSVCDYRQLCPPDSLLPFQVKTEYRSDAVFYEWAVLCESNGEETYQLGAYSASVLINNIEDKGTFITYLGNSLGIPLPCGNYYMRIAIESSYGIETFYSEVFTVNEDLDDYEFETPIFPIWSVWMWYNNDIKRSENTYPCNTNCKYTIITGNDALIPFQFRLAAAVSITSWILKNDDCYFSLDHTLLSIQTVGDYKNIIYAGDAIQLPCGIYYSEILIDGVTYYSEPILITNDIEAVETNYILQETGDRLLQEDSFGLLHEGIT